MLWLLLSLLRSDPARAVVGPLRVRFDFSHPLLYSMDDAARDLYQNTVLPEAADYVGRALSVERVEGPLRLARKCSSRGNNDHCYLRMDNASKLQKATYLRLWRARSWLIDFRRREIHRKYLMHVPLVNKTMDSLSGLLWRLVNSSSVGPIDTNRCGSRFQECLQNAPCEQFRYTHEMCGRSAFISDKLLEDGPGLNDTDLVVFVTYDDSVCSEATVASAFTCKHDPTTGRPIAGSINICKIQSHTDAVGTMIHELGHLVGIGADDYPWYREAGAPRPPRPADFCWPRPDHPDNIVRNGTQAKLVTRRAVAAARAYFDCQTLTGVELESDPEWDGISWDAKNAHLKMRAFMGSMMASSPVDYHAQRFSTIELAMLDDSGWYHVNYSQAAAPGWGHKAGCAFLATPCIADGVAAAHPFCTTDGAHGCSADFRSTARCWIYNHSWINETIPEEYRYFDDPELGGHEEMDYCPFYEPSEGTMCAASDTCVVSSNNGDFNESNDEGRRASCLPYECDEQGRVVVGHRKIIAPWRHTDYTCLYDGQHIFVGFPRGTIECPPRRLLCGTARPTGRIDTRSTFTIVWTSRIGKALVALAVAGAVLFLAMVRYRLEWLQDLSARANRPPRDIEKHCNRKEPWEAPAWVLDMLPPIVALVVAAAVFVFVFPLVSVFVDLITFRPNLDCVELVRVGMCEYYGFGPQARGALFDPSSL